MPTKSAKLDRQLSLYGWRYDARDEDFLDGDEPVDYREVLQLVPGMSVGDLMKYQEQKYAELVAARNCPPESDKNQNLLEGK